MMGNELIDVFALFTQRNTFFARLDLRDGFLTFPDPT